MLAVLALPLLVACGDDSEEMPTPTSTPSPTDNPYAEKLRGTSWKQVKYMECYHNQYEEKRYDGILTFANNNVLYVIGLDNKYGGTGTWWIQNNNEIRMDITSTDYGEEPDMFRGRMIACGFIQYIIDYVTDTQMRLSKGDNDGSYAEFVKVPYQEGNNQGGGGSSTGERPYITSYNFKATKTSITVEFMCNERPTSAIVKYGTSSPTSTISSTISGKQVSATVSGLKAGTKYYFKCTVSNQYGSSSSDIVSAMTNY